MSLDIGGLADITSRSAWREALIQRLSRVRLSIALLALPPVLLVLDPSGFFPGSWRDPWIYEGFFLFLPDHLQRFQDRYFTSRLPVTIPGFLLHQLLPPLAAYTALHIVLAWTALLAFFALARDLFGRTPAFLASLALGMNPLFFNAVGRNFPDGFGITYFLLVLLAAIRAGRGRSWLWPAAAGAFSVALVGSNLSYAILLPWIASGAYVVHRTRGEAAGRREALMYLAGAGSLLLVLGAVNAMFGGSWLFLQSSVRFAADFASRPSPFLKPASQWLWGATWLVLPAALFLASATWLVSRGHRSRPPPATWAHVQWLVLFLVAVLLQWGTSAAVLQYPFYTSVLLPSAFLALGALLAALVSEIDERSALLLAVFIVALGLPAHAVGPGPPTLPGRELLLPIAAAAAAPWLVLKATPGFRSTARLLGALAVVQWLAAGTGFDEEWERHGADRRGVFSQIVEAVATLRRLDPSQDYRFWYDKKEPGGMVFDAIAHTRFGCAQIWNDKFPETKGGVTCTGSRLVPGVKVAVLSRYPHGLRRAREALRAIGLDARLVGKAAVEGPISTVQIKLLELREGPP